MEQCLDAGRPAGELIAALKDPDWPVRYAAAVALGDRREPGAVGPLLALLGEEDAAPLYTQTADLGGIPAGSPNGREPAFPAGTDEATKAAWARRGRIKQAACLALGAIGIVEPAAVVLLCRYATDQGEDYAVRAAACKALGLLRQTSARAALERASDDPEWCTMTEARKGMTALPAGPGV